MGQIVLFPAAEAGGSRDNVHEALPADGAKILLFTGVRYERCGETRRGRAQSVIDADMSDLMVEDEEMPREA